MKKHQVIIKLSSCDVDGELIQQQNPEKVFTGEGKDKVGPGHYEVKREIASKKSGTNWHSSNVKRGVFAGAPSNPIEIGPGKYETAKQIPLPQYKQRGTSCFVSRVPKATTDVKKEEAEKRMKGEIEDEEEDEEEIDV